MSAHGSGGAPIIRTVETVFYDNDGYVVMRLSATQMTLHHPDGRIEQRKINDNLVLADGSTWNAAMLLAQPPVPIGVCGLCRKPPYTFPWRAKPTHGLVRLSRAKTCQCGTLCCPAHRVRCADGQVRCLRCAHTWSWKERLLSLFFAKED